jgi:hypothetical protein
MAFIADMVKTDPDRAWKLYHVRAESVESSAARNLTIGAIAALKAEMETLAAEAKMKAKTRGFLDFARFDCSACHHDLEIPSDRQDARYPGAPGRPRLKGWIDVVPKVLVDHLLAVDLGEIPGAKAVKDKAVKFQEKWKAVTDAALTRPFGDPGPLKTAAEDMEKWCGEFLDALDGGVVYTEAETKKLAILLAAAAVTKETLRDRETVATVTWALAALGGGAYGEKDPARRKALLELAPICLPDRESTSVDTPITVGSKSVYKDRSDRFRAFKPEEYVVKLRALK